MFAIHTSLYTSDIAFACVAHPDGEIVVSTKLWSQNKEVAGLGATVPCRTSTVESSLEHMSSCGRKWSCRTAQDTTRNVLTCTERMTVHVGVTEKWLAIIFVLQT
nr:hypothetical protein CFP56_79422 [Quercus suber]